MRSTSRVHASTLCGVQVSALPATVTIKGYTYRVDFGSGVWPRYHIVRKDRTCACILGRDCPAVGVVADYLWGGGRRASDPPEGYLVEAPACCPVCGAPAASDPALNSRRSGRGWRCTADAAHYWQTLAGPLAEAQRQASVALAGTAGDAASPDVPGLPGVPRQSRSEREDWLEAHRIRYPVWA
jgi:hypothetical protein